MLGFDVYLATKSELKYQVVEKFLANKFNIHRCSTSNCSDIPEQPVNSGYDCSVLRIIHTMSHYDLADDSIIIAIENEIVDDGDEEWVWDVANVSIKIADLGAIFHGQSRKAEFGSQALNYNQGWARIPREQYTKLVEQSKVEKLGLSKTMGEYYFSNQLGLAKDNWQVDPRFGGFDRRQQIEDALISAFSKVIKYYVKLYENYPIPNVTFKYQGEIWSNAVLNQLLNSLIVATIKHNNLNPTKIAGVDSRGYISGAVIADRLSVGFVPITKIGKTPGQVLKTSSFTEYSNIDLELNPNLIRKNDKVIIVDDLIATGGTFVGAKHLIEEAGAEVIGLLAVLKVDSSFDEAIERLGQTPIVVVN